MFLYSFNQNYIVICVILRSTVDEIAFKVIKKRVLIHVFTIKCICNMIDYEISVFHKTKLPGTIILKKYNFFLPFVVCV